VNGGEEAGFDWNPWKSTMGKRSTWKKAQIMAERERKELVSLLEHRERFLADKTKGEQRANTARVVESRITKM
jgi:hypothetical protein